MIVITRDTNYTIGGIILTTQNTYNSIEGMVINIQDTNYAFGGMVINTWDTKYFNWGMVINFRTLITPQKGWLELLKTVSWVLNTNHPVELIVFWVLITIPPMV